MTLFPHSPAGRSPSSGKTFILQFDGGSRGNPGPAGVGVTLMDEHGTPMYELSEFLGVCTNNIAEYTGLVRALTAAKALGATKAIVRSDSELLVRQINGIYKVKHPGIRPLYQKAMDLIRQIGDVRVSHVYREGNTRADKLANLAMDSAGKRSRWARYPRDISISVCPAPRLITAVTQRGPSTVSPAPLNRALTPAWPPEV